MSRRPAGTELTDAEREGLRARLRQAAAAIGTQQQAADAAGVSLRMMKHYLAGQSLPPAREAIERLAEASGCPATWILHGEGRARPAPVGAQDFMQRHPTAPDESAESRRQYFRLAASTTDALRDLYEVGRRADEFEVALQDAGASLAELVIAGQEADETERVERAAHLARVVHRQAHRLARMKGLKPT